MLHGREKTTLARRATKQTLPFSFRSDPDVPPFPQDRPLIIFDGVCVLCSGMARFVVARDKNRSFYLTTAQSPVGSALFTHYGFSTEDYETSLLVEDGVAYERLDAFERIMWRLGGVCRLAMVTRILPRFLRDFVYDRVARNRYSLFGKTEDCLVPPADWGDRFIS